MLPTLATGTRLVSTACSTQVIVISPPRRPVEVGCCGKPMVMLGATEPRALGAVPPGSSGIEQGRRYRDPVTGLDVLCIQAGAGPIEVDGRALQPTHF